VEIIDAADVVSVLGVLKIVAFSRFWLWNMSKICAENLRRNSMRGRVASSNPDDFTRSL
jgi:hypothetical protein